MVKGILGHIIQKNYWTHFELYLIKIYKKGKLWDTRKRSPNFNGKK